MNRFFLTKFSIFALASLVVVLAWQNSELKKKNTQLQENITKPYVGMWVPELHVDTLHGSVVSIGKPEKAFQVLFFFNPDCRYCATSLPAIKTLSTRIDDIDNIKFIGITNANSDETLEYVQQHKLDFAITPSVDCRNLSLFRAHAVPLVLVVDSHGRVRRYHRGILSTQEQIDTILAALH